MADARRLLDIDTLPDGVPERLLERARALASGARPAKLSGTVAQLFLEPSTRTRVSFEIAAGRTGLDRVHVDGARSSTVKGEALNDTVATLAAMGIAALVLRHPESGAPESVARAHPELPLVNAGDGMRAHPSQALLDVATLLDDGVALEKARIAIVGDIRHSRVARSDLALFSRLGVAEIRIAGPEAWLPAAESLPVRRCRNLEEALDGADVVICLRVQRERMDVAVGPDPEAFHVAWGLTSRRLAAAAPDVRVLHPGPVNRGVEIDDAVADGSRSLILRQVRMGVFMRMAIFEWLLGH